MQIISKRWLYELVHSLTVIVSRPSSRSDKRKTNDTDNAGAGSGEPQISNSTTKPCTLTSHPT
jgi:hypothetical protein